MTLDSGTRIGSYEIVALIGAGGMGEVYRARDTRLNRDVAIKVLLGSFASDHDRMARFEREAQLLAALSHPHIATIFGLEETGGNRALVMEFVEGRTLADRLGQGSGLQTPDRRGLPLTEALPIAKQLADALEYAHERGVIHRDLKPANIVLQGGRIDNHLSVKVLDFGLAKALERTPVGAELSHSPTLSIGATQAGMILGTAAYMSPEQARGTATDRRADIWAFGCVLYEILAGKQAFSGETVSDTLAAVLRSEPDWHALPSDTPRALRRLLRRCLEKDAKRRLHDMSDARIELDEALNPSADDDAVIHATVAPTARRGRGVVAGLVGVLLLALVGTGAIALRHLREVRTEPTLVRFALPPPVGVDSSWQVGFPAVSPDGRHVVFTALERGGSALWVKSLDSSEIRRLPGTEQAALPFWSPDGQFVAFVGLREIKTVSIHGGNPVVVANAFNGLGGTWNRDNVLLVSGPEGIGDLRRVRATGGAMTPVPVADGLPPTAWRRFPTFLPDGRRFLYSAGSNGRIDSIRAGSLDSAAPLMEPIDAESMAVYAMGHLFYRRAGNLMAQPFDPIAVRVTGDPFLLYEQAALASTLFGNMAFSASDSGTIAYVEPFVGTGEALRWFDRGGHPLEAIGEPGSYSNVVLSPDEKRVAASITKGSPRNRDVWLIDIERSAASRFTFEPGPEGVPIWSPDGARIAFGSNRTGVFDIYVRNTNGTGTEERLVRGGSTTAVTDWSRDGKYLIYSTVMPDTGSDIWTLQMSGDRKAVPVIHTPYAEDHAVLSPDDKWIAYTSDETGHPEVWVQSFPELGDKVRISRDGGAVPMWRGDGRELFFLAPDSTMMATTVDLTRGFRAGVPQPLFKTSLVIAQSARRLYGVSRDGQRFLYPDSTHSTEARPLNIVVNWRPSRPEK